MPVMRLPLLLLLLTAARGDRVPLVFHPDGMQASDWSFTADPVMGGRSDGSYRVDATGLTMEGTVRTVPSLNGPGFIKVQTKGWREFPDASACTHVGIVAKSLGRGYSGWRFGFGDSKAPGSSRHARGHKTTFADPGADFTNVSMPFTSFSNYWNAATGDNIVECADDAQYCPKEEHLKNLGTISVWAEGVNGEVSLTIKEFFLDGCGGKARREEGETNVLGYTKSPRSDGHRHGSGVPILMSASMAVVSLVAQNLRYT